MRIHKGLDRFSIILIVVGVINIGVMLVTLKLNALTALLSSAGIVAGIGTLQRKRYGWYSALVLSTVSLFAVIVCGVLNVYESIGAHEMVRARNWSIATTVVALIPCTTLWYFIRRRNDYA
jgi:hypothetical protein